MISSKASPSVVMGEVACYPGELSATDLAKSYAVSSGYMSKILDVSDNRHWLQVSSTARNGALGVPRKLLQPTDLFWDDFRKVNGDVRTDLSTSEQQLFTEAVEAGSLANRTAHHPAGMEHMRARATLLGSATLLSERHSLGEYGWFVDSQAWLSLIAINATSLDSAPETQ